MPAPAPGLESLGVQLLREPLRILVPGEDIDIHREDVETAGYTAKRVDFEDSLRTAISRGEPGSVDISVSRSLAPTRMNGNNVAIDEEMVGLTETALRHQMVIEGMNSKFRLLRTSIVGQ